MSGERYRGLSDVRRRNRRNIRSLLYRRAPVTRTELAEELGLTLPTVTTSVAGMLEEGLLVEQPAPSGGGRRPNLLRFNPSAGYALGVELGPYETAVGLYDLTGEPVVRRIYPAASDGYDEMIETLAGQLAELAALAPRRVLGAGIGCRALSAGNRVLSGPRGPAGPASLWLMIFLSGSGSPSSSTTTSGCGRRGRNCSAAGAFPTFSPTFSSPKGLPAR